MTADDLTLAQKYDRDVAQVQRACPLREGRMIFTPISVRAHSRGGRAPSRIFFGGRCG